MKFDYPSIAKIFAGERESDGFCGTGFLVTSEDVVTCAHVVLRHNDWYGSGWERLNDGSKIRLTLSFGDQSTAATQLQGTVVGCSQPDLALIHLDAPVGIQAVPLVCGLSSDYEAALSLVQGSVIGYSRTEGGKLIERSVEDQVSLAWDFHTHQLLSIQVSGGISPGMSGSPLLVKIADQAICFGMAHLGGDGSATSRIIVSDTVVNFLAQHNVFPSNTVQAADCFPTIPSEHLLRAASRLKEAVNGLLTNKNSAHDRKVLQESLLNGLLVFSSGAQNTVASGNQVNISRNKYRVIVHIDEEDSTSFGEQLFPPATGVAPPPPSVFFVGRSGDLVTVRSLLQTGQSAVVVVEGWPGVGKSSFASILGRDIALMTSFPDGVLWTALGQQPNLFSSLSSWGRALGIRDILDMPSLSDAAARISRVLLPRRMLLIVDDVWSADDLTPFLSLHSPGCRLLITTRRPAIA